MHGDLGTFWCGSADLEGGSPAKFAPSARLRGPSGRPADIGRLNDSTSIYMDSGWRQLMNRKAPRFDKGTHRNTASAVSTRSFRHSSREKIGLGSSATNSRCS